MLVFLYQYLKIDLYMSANLLTAFTSILSNAQKCSGVSLKDVIKTGFSLIVLAPDAVSVI